MQPGQTVSPGGSTETPNWQFNPSSDTPASPPPTQASTSSSPEQLQPSPQPPVASNQGPSISWTASEFIAHSKTGGWYGLLAIGAVLLAAGVYLVTKDKISAVVVIVVAVLFGVSAARKPRELQYEVDDKGVNIGGKLYPYASFRSFSIVQEGAVESIWFMPLKRFMPIVSIYFDPTDGDKIVDIISQYLPVEQRGLDPVDRLMHRLRF